MGCCSNIKVKRDILTLRNSSEKNPNQTVAVKGQTSQTLFVETTREMPYAAKFVEIRPTVQSVQHDLPDKPELTEIIIQEEESQTINKLNIHISQPNIHIGKLETYENELSFNSSIASFTTKSRLSISHQAINIPTDFLSPTSQAKYQDFKVKMTDTNRPVSQYIRFDPIGAANFEFEDCILQEVKDPFRLPKIKPNKKYNQNMDEINKLLEELVL